MFLRMLGTRLSVRLRFLLFHKPGSPCVDKF